MAQRQLLVPNTPYYKLLQIQLGEDPVAFIHERRERTPPVSFAMIAEEMRARVGHYVTHELPRRWYLHSIGQPTRRAAKAA